VRSSIVREGSPVSCKSCYCVDDSKDRGLLEGSKDFTVLIKNYIEFPVFGVKR